MWNVMRLRGQREKPDVEFKDKKSSSFVYKPSCESLLPYCLCPLSSSALPPDAAVESPLVIFLSWEPWGRSGCTPWESGGVKTKAWGRIFKQVSHLTAFLLRRRGKALPTITPYLLHLFTAALYSLVRVYAGGDGGQLLLFLTLSHLGLHAVDEALDCGDLQEENTEIHSVLIRKAACDISTLASLEIPLFNSCFVKAENIEYIKRKAVKGKAANVLYANIWICSVTEAVK